MVTPPLFHEISYQTIISSNELLFSLLYHFHVKTQANLHEMTFFRHIRFEFGEKIK